MFLTMFKRLLKGSKKAFKPYMIKGRKADCSSAIYCADEMGYIFIRDTCPRKYIDVKV
jgi:hypothetical protein